MGSGTLISYKQQTVLTDWPSDYIDHGALAANCHIFVGSDERGDMNIIIHDIWGVFPRSPMEKHM